MQTPWEEKTYRYIEELCQSNVISDDREKPAKTVAHRYFENEGGGRSPRVIAATAVRIVRKGEDWASQEEIAEVADVSVTAMTLAAKEMQQYGDDLVP